jgi:hypothetical protein
MSYERRNLEGAFPSCVGCDPPELGFSLNPFKLIGKIVKPVAGFATMLIPGGPLVGAAASIVAGRLLSRRKSATVPKSAAISARVRSAVAAASQKRAATVTGATPAAAVEAYAAAPPPGAASAARPADMSYEAAGSATPGPSAPEEPAAKPSTPTMAGGAGMGVALLVIGGLALLSKRKR